MPALSKLAAGLQLSLAAISSASTLQLFWTSETDGDDCERRRDCGSIGPDGPWQAVSVSVGSGQIARVWPSAGWFSQFPTTTVEGVYDPNESTPANETDGDIFLLEEMQEAWLSDEYTNTTVNGTAYVDYMQIVSRQLSSPLRANILAADTWTTTYPNGETYNSSIGNLGLGPVDEAFELSGDEEDGEGLPLGLLDQLKEIEDISSRSYGLHIGSVALQQPGSLILGGYEQNRVLGNVGIFNLEVGFPTAFLIDMVLAVETGRSPLNKTGSVWQGLGGHEEGERLVSLHGGTRGSAMILPNPTAPYMYLPMGNCEAIAEQLPVTRNEDLNLWTWNTEDPDYERIVNSPAYLGFVISDSEANNITIKVPFKLLNLTLEAPLVDEPTQYFPCQPTSPNYGFWQLGRAFLQAAFLGLNFEEQVMYLAQAPGPDMDQSIRREVEEGEKQIRSNEAATFEKTWRSTWTVIDEADEDGLPTIPDGEGDEESSLSPGAVAGIVVGAVVLVVCLAVASVFLMKRRRATRALDESGDDSDYKLDPREVPQDGVQYEMHAPNKTHEAPGVELYHEMEGSPVERFREMEGSSVERANEMDGSPVERSKEVEVSPIESPRNGYRR